MNSKQLAVLDILKELVGAMYLHGVGENRVDSFMPIVHRANVVIADAEAALEKGESDDRSP